MGSILLAPGCGFAESGTPVEYWKEQLQKGTLDQISKQLADPGVLPWPKIISSYAAQKLPEKQKQRAAEEVNLATNLGRKFANDFKPDVDLSQEQLEDEVQRYTRISKALYHSGGYCNLLLSDAALRLAVFRVSGWLVLHPADTNESKKLVSMVDAPAVNAKELLDQLSDQDADMQSRKGSIGKIEPADNLLKAYAAIGIGVEMILFPPGDGTANLLKSPSVARLAFRMAMTEEIVRVNLAGSLRFFELGGLYSELDLKDIRPFTKRMGTEARAFKHTLMKSGYFTENDVLYFVNLHKDDGVKAAFLDAVLK